jgi:serine/threonine protein kinase
LILASQAFVSARTAMTTRRNDNSAAPPPKDEDGSAAPDLLTSEDLFGDMVDAPPPSSRSEAAPNRKGPIKVQVSEPGAPRKNSPLASPANRVGEKLPDDVAALLDAFSEPAEAALREEAYSESPGLEELVDEDLPPAAPDAADKGAPSASGDGLLDGMLGAGEGESATAVDADDAVDIDDTVPPPSVVKPQPPPVVTAADEDEEVNDLLGVLGPADKLPPPIARPTPKLTREKKEKDESESLRDLLGLRRTLPAPVEDEIGEALKPAARTATKFTAAAPRKEVPSAGPGLDLAALAEDAFAAAEPPPAVPARLIQDVPDEAAASEVLAAAPESPVAGVERRPATEPVPAGTRDYGPYRLLERVAVGGMAEVFRAKRTGVEGFEKVVAVKRILSHLSDNKEFVDMFIDEAKMVAGLTHANIVQMLDLGKLEKSYYIAMEYVHGRDLRTILRRARDRGLKIPLDISTYVVSKVCAALEYAHRKKDDRGQPLLIVHRDISPQNILISFEGDVKLTDFGIAKAATKASTTDKGALRGKLLYMSPEQAWGKPMDKRSDVFSLGIVFYEMLTEQKPFLGTSEMSILETVRECRVPPPTTLNDRIPEKLERVVMKALERDPEVRYQDAGDMLRDLERVLHDWQPATASGLARFLELLFDEHERGDAVTEGEARGTGPESGLEMELPEPPPGPAPEAPAPAPAKDPMSIQKLLKRFGIK